MRIWSAVVDGVPAAPPMKHIVFGAAFSRDKGRLLSWGPGVQIWNADDGTPASPAIRLPQTKEGQ